MNVFLLPFLCCDDRKGAWEISDFSLFKGLVAFKLTAHEARAFAELREFCSHTCSIPETALSLTLPGAEKLNLNKINAKQTLPQASTKQSGSNPS